jgi:hypothetical protein
MDSMTKKGRVLGSDEGDSAGWIGLHEMAGEINRKPKQEKNREPRDENR